MFLRFIFFTIYVSPYRYSMIDVHLITMFIYLQYREGYLNSYKNIILVTFDFIQNLEYNIYFIYPRSEFHKT